MRVDSSSTTFLLIGGNGFLGSAFADHLCARGIDVLRWGRNGSFDSDPRLNLLKERGTPIVAVDFAYASVPNSSFDDPVRDFSENLRNVLRHVEFVKDLKRAVYVYVSSGGTVYGNPIQNLPIAEDHQTVPLAPYGITKLACERYALMYNQVHGLDVRIVRPSNVYGPGQRPFRGQGIVPTIMSLLTHNQEVQVYGDGSIVRDYLYIEDFCRAIDDVIDHGTNGGIYNIGSGKGVSITELLVCMQNTLGLDSPRIARLPKRPFDVRYNVLNAGKLRALAAWSPQVFLDKGLLHTASWLQQQSKPAS